MSKENPERHYGKSGVSIELVVCDAGEQRGESINSTRNSYLPNKKDATAWQLRSPLSSPACILFFLSRRRGMCHNSRAIGFVGDTPIYSPQHDHILMCSKNSNPVGC